MSNFDNEQYESLVTNLIGDAFYTETSYRGKISIIRSYAEVIIRKLLDWKPNKSMTLGQEDVKQKIKSLPNHDFIETAMRNIQKKGNSSIHTQCLDDMSLDDFENIVDSLFDMLSFLLINYFEKYEFGSRIEVMRSFSLLPPIIRYKVLDFLSKKHSNNIHIIDRLVLAIMKAFNVNEANKWIEERKSSLSQMVAMSEETYNKLIETYGMELAKEIKQLSPSNMYQVCKQKIFQVGSVIDENGPVYSDFESALPYYKEFGKIESNDPEIIEFNDIMDFLYLGRKEKLEELSSESKPFVVMNFYS